MTSHQRKYCIKHNITLERKRSGIFAENKHARREPPCATRSPQLSSQADNSEYRLGFAESAIISIYTCHFSSNHAPSRS